MEVTRSSGGEAVTVGGRALARGKAEVDPVGGWTGSGSVENPFDINGEFVLELAAV